MYWHTVPALSLVRSRSERGKMWGGLILATWLLGVAESGDDFTKFSRIYQWFQTLIHPALMQRRLLIYLIVIILIANLVLTAEPLNFIL